MLSKSVVIWPVPVSLEPEPPGAIVVEPSILTAPRTIMSVPGRWTTTASL